MKNLDHFRDNSVHEGFVNFLDHFAIISLTISVEYTFFAPIFAHDIKTCICSC